MEEYYRELKTAREKNKRLGYGEGNEWSQRGYEEQRREFLQEKRIKPDTQEWPVSLRADEKTFSRNESVLERVGQSIKW